MNRREFSRSAIMASALISASPLEGISGIVSPSPAGLKKGIMWGSIGVGRTITEKFQAAKEAGFDGVQPMSHLDRKEVLAASRATGLGISSVCGEYHWKYPLSDPDPGVRKLGAEALKVTLEDANAYGTDTVLLVPGIVNEKVAYDQCWNRVVGELEKVLPLAEKLNVKIALENVWNNFLLSPMEAASFVDHFRSPYITFFFDCGNILVYGWPEQWIRILGKRLARVHIKDFSRKIADTQGRGAGFKVKLLEGDVNWPAVMKSLDEIGYHGWTTVEMPGGDTKEGLKDLCDRLVKILES